MPPSRNPGSAAAHPAGCLESPVSRSRRHHGDIMRQRCASRKPQAVDARVGRFAAGPGEPGVSRNHTPSPTKWAWSDAAQRLRPPPSPPPTPGTPARRMRAVSRRACREQKKKPDTRSRERGTASRNRNPATDLTRGFFTRGFEGLVSRKSGRHRQSGVLRETGTRRQTLTRGPFVPGPDGRVSRSHLRTARGVHFAKPEDGVTSDQSGDGEASGDARFREVSGKAALARVRLSRKVGGRGKPAPGGPWCSGRRKGGAGATA